MHARFGLLLALLVCTPAFAEFVLIPEGRTVEPGGMLSITLQAQNDSSTEELHVELPARIILRTRGVEAAPDIVLSPATSQPMQVTIAANGFLRLHYTGRLPEGLLGNLVLEPVGLDSAPLGISVTRAEDEKAPAKEPLPANAGQPESAPTEASKAEAAVAAVGPSDRDAARFVTAFSPNEPNYFAVGWNGPTNVKFQVSLKFRLFNPDTQTPFLEKLYIAYSQTSIWQVGASSAPFYDSSYRPSIFFLDEDISQWPFRNTSRLGFQTGFEHESNGKDAEASRSINTAFVRPILTFPFAQGKFISVAPKIYTYLEKEDNPDIAYYRGYTDLLIKVGSIDGIQLASTLRKGTGAEPYSVELDLSIPLKTPMLGNLGGYLHMQYFDGYGESLLDYNKKLRSQFRIGLMITR
jgi:outer membrane phospholipase A